MFGCNIFGTLYFAGSCLVAPEPPPPPPPPAPVPEAIEFCHEFAIGPCVGTEGGITKIPVLGRSSCVPAGRAVGFSSNTHPCSLPGIGQRGG